MLRTLVFLGALAGTWWSTSWLVAWTPSNGFLLLLLGVICLASVGYVVWAAYPLFAGSRGRRMTWTLSATGGILALILGIAQVRGAPASQPAPDSTTSRSPTPIASMSSSPSHSLPASVSVTPTERVISDRGRVSVGEGRSVVLRTGLRIAVSGTYSTFASINVSTSDSECLDHDVHVGETLVVEGGEGSWHRLTADSMSGQAVVFDWQFGSGPMPAGSRCSM